MSVAYVLGIDASTKCSGFALLRFDINAQMPGQRIHLVAMNALSIEDTKADMEVKCPQGLLGLRARWGDVPACHKEALRNGKMAQAAALLVVAHTLDIAVSAGLLVAYENPIGQHQNVTAPLNRVAGAAVTSAVACVPATVGVEVMRVSASTAKAACRISTFRPRGTTAADHGEKSKVVAYVRQVLLPEDPALVLGFDSRDQGWQEAAADAAMIGYAGAMNLVKELRDAEAKRKR